MAAELLARTDQLLDAAGRLYAYERLSPKRLARALANGEMPSWRRHHFHAGYGPDYARRLAARDVKQRTGHRA